MSIRFLLLAAISMCLAGCDEPIDDFFTKGPNAENRCEKLIESMGIVDAYPVCVKDAKTGDALAQIALAEQLQSGKLGEERKAEGLAWLKKAVDNHHPIAELRLGKFFIRQEEIDKGIKYIKRAAENNNLEAQLIMGKLLYKGEYYQQSLDEAKKWFERAVEQKSSEAKFYLSLMYRDDENDKAAQHKADRFLMAAAQDGLVEAQVEMGERLTEQKNYQQAASWLAKASQKEYAKAQYLLAKLILKKQITSPIDPILLLEKSSHQYLPAQVELAHCYRLGLGVPKDQAKAKRYLENAAELGDAQAFYEVGVSMIRGDFGFSKDIQHGIDYLKIAAAKGYQPAKFTLSILFVEGEPILKDKGEVIKNLAIQAIQDDTAAQFKLAKVLMDYDIPLYDRVAFYWLQKAARTDDSEIHFLLAKCYEEGIGTKTNFNKAFAIFTYLAERGYTKAYLELAKIYHNGYGVPNNDYLAKDWIVKAITAQADGAKEYARNLFREGMDFEISDNDSIQLIEFAAESELPSALYAKGQYHLEGQKGYTRSIKTGIYFLKEAAQKGYTKAQRHLGMIYENNLYGMHNSTSAYEWYEKAAQSGDEFAQYRLAYLYFHRDSTQQDKILAYAWANLAASTGMLPAEDLRDLIFSELTPEELEAGQALSSKFLKQYQRHEDVMFITNDPLDGNTHVNIN